MTIDGETMGGRVCNYFPVKLAIRAYREEGGGGGGCGVFHIRFKVEALA
jgi:hypothetical protein